MVVGFSPKEPTSVNTSMRRELLFRDATRQKSVQTTGQKHVTKLGSEQRTPLNTSTKKHVPRSSRRSVDRAVQQAASCLGLLRLARIAEMVDADWPDTVESSVVASDTRFPNNESQVTGIEQFA